MLEQGAQGDAVDAAAQDGVELRLRAFVVLLAQRDFLESTGLGVEDEEMFGARQVGFDQRIEAVGRADGGGRVS